METECARPHQDVIFLGELDLDRASAMSGPYSAKYDLAFSSMLSSKVNLLAASVKLMIIFYR